MNRIILIGIAAAGKTTLGKILAKNLNYNFTDTDSCIEGLINISLQQYLENNGYLKVRELEENYILNNLDTDLTDNQIIATGGSVIYSDKAMQKLSEVGVLLFLNIDYSEFNKRFKSRGSMGFAGDPNMTLMQVYQERLPLYQKWAKHTIDCSNLNSEQALVKLQSLSLKTIKP